MARGRVPLLCDEGIGCCDEYSVFVTYACGTGTLGILEDVQQLAYQRRLDDVSTAQIVVSIPGASPDCCDVLGDLRAWCHEVVIQRCGQTVWTGPIIRVTWTPDEVLIDARDVTAWLDRNVIDRTLSWTGTDLSVIADELIRDNVNLGDEAGCMVLDTRMSGITGDRKIEAVSGYVGDALRNLAREGLDYTAVGRRLVLFGAEPLSLVGPLSEPDFTGPIQVVDDGLSGATDAVVVGKGVVGRYSLPDPACGRLQVLRKDETIVTVRDAQELAARIVRSGYPTPLRIDLDGQATLSADAPVCMDQLIPGVDVRVFATETCREVTQDLRLTQLLVQVGPDNESVQIQLEPAGAAAFDLGTGSA